MLLTTGWASGLGIACAARSDCSSYAPRPPRQKEAEASGLRELGGRGERLCHMDGVPEACLYSRPL